MSPEIIAPIWGSFALYFFLPDLVMDLCVSGKKKISYQ